MAAAKQGKATVRIKGEQQATEEQGENNQEKIIGKFPIYELKIEYILFKEKSVQMPEIFILE